MTAIKESDSAPQLPNGDFLRQLLEENPAMLLITDAQAGDHPIIYVNAAFEQATGYLRAEVLGKNPRFLQNEDRDQPDLAIIRAALRDETECTVTLRNYHKNGALFWNEIRIRPLRDAMGTVTHFIGVQNDVTERVRAELALRERQNVALRESELRYRALVENFPNGLIALYDHDLRYTVINGEGLAHIRLNSADLEGKQLRDVFPPEVYERDEPALRAALQGERTVSVVELGDRHFRVITAPVFDDDGNVAYGLVMSQDITERIQAEQATRRLAARYQSILAAMVEGVVLYDETATAILCNAAAATILQVSVEDIIGFSITKILETDPAMNVDEAGNAISIDNYPVMVTLRTGEPQTNVIMGYRPTPDTPIAWLTVNTQPLIAEDTGEVYGVVTTFIDITEQRRMQQQTVDAVLHEARVQLLSNFIRSTSHELRTPLSVISTSAYFLRRSDDPVVRTRHADKVTEQIKRLTTLIDMLLLMSKLDSDIEISLVPTRLSDVVEVVSSEIGPDCNAKGHTFSMDVGDLKVIGNGDFLVTMLNELVKNACHYTPAGGEISLWAQPEDDNVLIGVDDNGMGISPEDLPHIYEHFWRKDDSHAEPGFGLGLTAVYKIVDLHNGTINVESRPGEGTWFRVRLPGVAG